ncbi:cell envelope integrity protein TolA [Marinomonas sp. THO17]|uniref:cell envelope integrity protein TolA n=1 Tax=Marinomonas sp. THO17 TaxID=3149048 RepID=UPI00336BEAF4
MKWLRSDSYSLPIVLALVLHTGVVLAAFFAVGFGTSERKEPKQPVIVNAKIIDVSDTIIGRREAEQRAAEKRAAALAEKKRKEAAEQARQREVARKALEEKQKQVAQAKRLKEQAAAKQRQEAERKALEQKRIAQEAEKKRLEEQKRIAEQKRQEEVKRVEEQKRREEALVRQAEADRLAEQERKRQEEAARIAAQKKAEQEAARQAAAEEEAKRRAADEAQMVQSMSDLINARVTAAWIRPPSARNGMKTELRIFFLPNGEVMSAQVMRSSGDAIFDRNALNAVYRVQRIEELSDVDSYIFERNFRQVDLIFNPQDLRN